MQNSWTRYAVALSLAAIVLYLLSRYLLHLRAAISSAPLWVAIVAGGLPLFYGLLFQIWKHQFGADFLAGLSIVTAILMASLSRTLLL